MYILRRFYADSKFEYNLNAQVFAHWEVLDADELEDLDNPPCIHPHPKHVLPLNDTKRGETVSLDLSVSCRTSKREVNENLTIEIAQAIVGQLIPLKMNGIILNKIHVFFCSVAPSYLGGASRVT